MCNSKILAFMLPLLLAGCLDFVEDDTFYTPPPQAVSAPPVAVPAAVGVAPAHSAPADCCCDGAVKQQPCPQPDASAPDWHPSEGQLVRAGDLVMELQRSNNGVRPSHAAMATHLRTHMGVSASQADGILEEMGL